MKTLDDYLKDADVEREEQSFCTSPAQTITPTGHETIIKSTETAEEDYLGIEMAMASMAGDTAELNKAFRKLAKLSHPDLQGGVNGNGNNNMAKHNELVSKWRQDAELAAKTWNIAAVLDDSGSMRGLRRREAITAFNTFIDRQRKVTGRAVLTIHPLHAGRNCEIANIEFRDISVTPKLLQAQFRCDGHTPLLDGIGETIRKLEQNQAESNSTIVLIVTDGEENGSRKWSISTLQPVIAEKLDLGWQFVYVSVCLGSLDTAKRIGIPENCITSFENFKEVFKSINDGVTKLRLGEIKQLTLNR